MPTVLPAPVGISPEHRDADLQRESLLYLEFPLQGRNCKSASTSTNAKQTTQASQKRGGAREGPSGCASHGVAGSRSFGFLNPPLLFAPCLLPPEPCPSFIHIHGHPLWGDSRGYSPVWGWGDGHESDNDGAERTVVQSFSEAT